MDFQRVVRLYLKLFLRVIILWVSVVYMQTMTAVRDRQPRGA